MLQRSPREPDAGEIVVLVRDIGFGWVRHLAEAARAQGCQVGLVAGVDDPRLAAAVDATSVVDDPTDPEQVAAAVRDLAGARRVGAVLSTTDGCVAVAAQAAEMVGLRRTPAAPIVAARNKFAVREALHRAGLPGPGHALMTGEGQAADAAATAGLPAVVKPLSGTGSHLVRTVTTVDELAEAYCTLVDRLPAGQLRHLYRRPLDCGSRGLVDPARAALVEGVLAGREFCVDVIVRDRVVEQLPLVDKFLVDDRFFELGFVTPPLELPPEREQAVRAAAGEAVRALGLDNTVAHVEVIDDQTRGPTIVEINAGRPGGQAPLRLNVLTGGVDMVAELAAVHRGATADRPPARLPIPLASLYMFGGGAGRIRAIHGLDKIAEHPDVVSVTAEASAGDVLAGEHEEKIATVVVAGFLGRDDLVETYHELAGAIQLELDPL